ncbi:hypothetical protein DFQ26_005158 [Actinomortierella ambigua]|nr:hypothetical protein DFQ26_005158 [Actinomortierella ambigua]
MTLVIPNGQRSSGWSSPVGERTSTTPAGTAGGFGSAFDADMLADILIQYQAHAKTCFQEIQDHQRSLGTKIRHLDTVATQALHSLLAVQYQTRTHVDQLQFVHTLARQTETMSKTLAGTLERLSRIVVMHEEGRDGLQGGPSLNTTTTNNNNSLASLLPPLDKERYPHLHAFFAQPFQPSASLLAPRPAPPPTTTLISPSPSIAGSLSTITLATATTAAATTLTSPTPPLVRSGASSPGGTKLISSALPATTSMTTITSTTSSSSIDPVPSLSYSGHALGKTGKPLTGTAKPSSEMLAAPTSLNGGANLALEQSEDGGDRPPGVAHGTSTTTTTTTTTTSAPLQPAPPLSSTSMSSSTPMSMSVTTGSLEDGSGAGGGGLGVVEGLSGLMSMLTRTINDGASTLAGMGQEIQRQAGGGSGGGITGHHPPVVTTAGSTDVGEVDRSKGSTSTTTTGLVSEATENLRRLARTPSLRRLGRS